MAYYWIFITFAWFGSVSLQYINTAGPAAESLMDPFESSLHYSLLPYVNYFNLQNPKNNYENLQNDDNMEQSQYYQQENDPNESQRKRRTTQEVPKDEDKEKHWQPNLVDNDKTFYLQNDGRASPFILQSFTNSLEGNLTDRNLPELIDKRSFSPWGGKRNTPNIVEHMWSWKRSPGIREPSMPKRVRFSPWGGKRSGQMIYKPGNKGSKIIFSASVPELTRIISNYLPNSNRLDVTGFQFVPTLDKRHPIKILALSTNMDERTLRDALPFNTFVEPLPRMFKPGHPYSDVNLKKDGKRKVKFSAWGGKRSPPIIGPIWTPASQDFKESTLDNIVLVRNNQENENSAKIL